MLNISLINYLLSHIKISDGICLKSKLAIMLALVSLPSMMVCFISNSFFFLISNSWFRFFHPEQSKIFFMFSRLYLLKRIKKKTLKLI